MHQLYIKKAVAKLMLLKGAVSEKTKMFASGGALCTIPNSHSPNMFVFLSEQRSKDEQYSRRFTRLYSLSSLVRGGYLYLSKIVNM